MFKVFHSIGQLESMIEGFLEYMMKIVLLQSQIGIHETNIRFREKKQYEFRQ